jgi:hypothetical protein
MEKVFSLLVRFKGNILVLLGYSFQIIGQLSNSYSLKGFGVGMAVGGFVVLIENHFINKTNETITK